MPESDGLVHKAIETGRFEYDGSECNKTDSNTASTHTRESLTKQNDKRLPINKGPVRFTPEEDNYLRKGFEKFGVRWTTIFKCPLYEFEHSRVARTLRM